MLMIRMSMSPSLSKSPNAQPRLLVRRGNAGPGSVDEFFKGLIAEIAKNRARRLVGILAELSFHFRVNVTGNHEEIGVTVVVEIDDAGAPANIARLHANTGRAA